METDSQKNRPAPYGTGRFFDGLFAIFGIGRLLDDSLDLPDEVNLRLKHLFLLLKHRQLELLVLRPRMATSAMPVTFLRLTFVPMFTFVPVHMFILTDYVLKPHSIIVRTGTLHSCIRGVPKDRRVRSSIRIRIVLR